MGVSAETAKEKVQLLVHHGVIGNLVLEPVSFLLRRQFAIEEEMADFEVTAVLGQFLYAVAAVSKDAIFAVDEGDFGFAAARRGKARVIGKHPRVGVKPAEIHDPRAFAALDDRKLPRALRGIVDQGDSVAIGDGRVDFGVSHAPNPGVKV